MPRQRNSKQNLLIIGFFMQLCIFTPKVFSGSFGAQIFCTMRDGGNDHESSWQAAYNYIKKQKGGIFKTSPKQAASQIIETVIRDKEEFGDCVQYLDKLYPDRELQRQIKKEEEQRKNDEIEKSNRRKKIEELIEQDNESYSEDIIDRYSY